MNVQVEEPTLLQYNERLNMLEKIINDQDIRLYTLEDIKNETEEIKSENNTLKKSVDNQSIIIRVIKQINTHYNQISEYRRQQLWKERCLSLLFFLSLCPLTMTNSYLGVSLSLGMWTLIGSFWLNDNRSTIINYFTNEIKKLYMEIESLSEPT